MKTMKVLVLVSLSLGLGFGCATNPDEILDPVEDSAEEILSLEQPANDIPCQANYHCPLGQRCNLLYPYPGGDGSLWTCRSYFVIGPVTNSCIDTPQCQAQFHLNSTCVYRNPGGSYGECIVQ